MGNRSQVRTNESLTLTVVYRDGSGDLIDPTTAPTLYIYDSSVSDTNIDADIAALTYTNATAGPFTATQVSTGFYEYTYTVPSASTAEGAWTDLWVATIDTVTVHSQSTFNVELPGSTTVEFQQLSTNKLIVIQLGSTIADTSGNTLGSDTSLYFLTRLDPYYCSVESVRNLVGAAIDYIDDITLALMIGQASEKADFIRPTSTSYAGRQAQALRFYTCCKAGLMALSLAQQNAETAVSSGTSCSKTLGAFEISSGSASSGSAALLEHIMDLKNKLEACAEDWFVVVQSGGSLAPGQSFMERFAVKGQWHPDRRNGGRQWVDPRDAPYSQPMLNDRSHYFNTDRVYQHHSGWMRDISRSTGYHNRNYLEVE